MIAAMYRRTSRTAALFGLLVLTLGLLLGPGTPARAHAVLVSSSPVPDVVLGNAPTEVVLTFSEGVRKVPGKIRVLGPDNSRVDRGEPTFSGAVVNIPVDPAGPQGTYLVSYRVISADGHPVTGAYTYSVGTPSTPPADTGTDRVDPVVEAALPVTRYLGYAGLVLLVGPVLVLSLLWPRRLTRRGPAKLVWTGMGLTAASTLAALWLQAPYTTGGGPFSVSGSALRDVLGSTVGAAYLVRLGVLAAAAILLHALLRDPPTGAVAGPTAGAPGTGTAGPVGPAAGTAGPAGPAGPVGVAAGPVGVAVADADDVAPDPGSMAESEDPDEAAESAATTTAAASPTRSVDAPTGAQTEPAGPPSPAVMGRADQVLLVILGVAGLATWPVAGHPAASPVPAVSVTVDTVHLGAMAVWLGGLVMLVGFLLRQASERELEAILPVWSRWAAAAVSALLLAGVVQALIEVGTVDALFSTTYGRLILAKVGLFALVIGVAAVSRQLIRQRRAAGSPRRIRQLVGVELAVVAVVLAVSSALVQTTPARTAAADAKGGAGYFATTLTSSLYRLQVEVDPSSTGVNSVHLYAYTPENKPLPVVEWNATAALPALEVEPIEIALLPLTDNHVTGEVSLPSPGEWQFRFTLRISELDQATVSTTVAIN